MDAKLYAPPQAPVANVALAFRAAEIVVWILMFVQCFVIKDINRYVVAPQPR
jgi:hypothetical protein